MAFANIQGPREFTSMAEEGQSTLSFCFSPFGVNLFMGSWRKALLNIRTNLNVGNMTQIGKSLKTFDLIAN